MKKLLILLVVLSPICAVGQSVSSTFGMEMGVSIPTLTERRVDRFNNISNVKAGGSFRIGAVGHFQIGEYFGLRPAIFYKYTSLFASPEISLYDIEIPLLIAMSYENAKMNKFFFGAGPNFNITVKGNETVGMVKDPIYFGNGPLDSYRQLAYALQFKLGWQYSAGFSFNLFCNIGLGNRSNNSNFIYRSADLLGINFGYLFGDKYFRKNGN